MPCPKMLRVKEVGNILFHVHIDWKELKELVVSMFCPPSAVGRWKRNHFTIHTHTHTHTRLRT
jgi:hypothetical protein